MLGTVPQALDSCVQVPAAGRWGSLGAPGRPGPPQGPAWAASGISLSKKDPKLARCWDASVLAVGLALMRLWTGWTEDAATWVAGHIRDLIPDYSAQTAQ